MPVMNGLEAIARLRADDRFAATPIMAMPGDKERCFNAGANEYMSKPVSLKNLLHMVEKLIKERLEGNSGFIEAYTEITPTASTQR